MRDDKYKYIEFILTEYKVYQGEIKDIDIVIAQLNSREQLKGLLITEKVKTYTISSSVENMAIDTVDKIRVLELHKEHCMSQLERIDNALNSLSEEERQVVNLKYIEDYKWFQVAYKVNAAEKTCKRAASRALEKIAKILNL